MSTIVSFLSEVSSEELCLPQANLDLKKENFSLKVKVMLCFKIS